MSAAIPHPDQQPVEAPPSATETTPVPEELASETLYIQNLNERIKMPGAITMSSLGRFATHRAALFGTTVLKASLRGLFKSYGEVLDVVAHKNLRMRGQAFVSFASVDIAKKAAKEVGGFPLYSKPMVRLAVNFFFLD